MAEARARWTMSGVRVALATTLLVVFAVLYPPIAHLMDGGEIFGGLVIVPIALAAWTWGLRTGMRLAVAGVVYADGFFAVETFIVRHKPFSLYWLIGTAIGLFVIPFIAGVVGRLSEALRTKAAAERALRESEQHFRDIFTNAPFGYFRSTPEGRAVVANPTFARMIGFSSVEEGLEQVNARGIADSLYADPGLRASIVSDVLRSDQWQQREILFRRRDGAPLRTNLFIRPYRRPDGGPVELEGFLEDVTERRLAEEKAADARQHLEAVLEALPDLILVLDRTGKLLSCNMGTAVLPGIDPARFIGRNVSDMLPEEAARAVVEAVAAASTTGTHAGATYRVTSGASSAWFELSLAAVGDVRNPDCRFVALCRDVTDRKTLEQQLHQAQKMEAVGRLAGGVAHDFNNIIMVILGFCDLINAHPDDPKRVQDDLGAIRDAANRAGSLTRQLLAFSRKQILLPKVMDVRELLRRMEPMFSRSLREDIALRIETGDEPAMVKVDEGQLQQVVLNLVLNARDAMPLGGTLALRVQSVTFATDDQSKPVEVAPGSYAELIVSDTGTGMDAHTQSHLFEPFFTTKEFGKGTGLGLSIVYGIVKQSDGYIYADSRLGEGTTFRVYLPKAVESAAYQTPLKEEAARAHGTGTILLVEDERAVRELVQRSLQEGGYTVRAAESGVEAIRLCDENRGRVDLLVSDVVMPGMSGTRVARAFRGFFPGAPVIFMTGYPGQEDLADRELDAIVLHKPVSTNDLLNAVRHALAAR